MTKKTKTIKLDKYARNARRWKDDADIVYRAATRLFETGDLLLVFPAATLGHHALEMYLKAALISEGLTVFNPKDINRLDSPIKLRKADCAWDHDLVTLARQLARKRPDFDLAQPIIFLLPLDDSLGVRTLERGFAAFNPFFYELRYPQELSELDGVGSTDKLALDELVHHLRPLLEKLK